MDTTALYILVGYFFGSFPTGVLIGKWVGTDPRTGGSKNIGASNVARTAGKKWGFLTLVIDVAKGLIPTLLAVKSTDLEIGMATGFAAVVGHCFPLWLRFKGGKGVATAFGAIAAILPVIALISALAWFTLVYFTRIPALGSLAAAALFVALAQMDYQPTSVHFFTLAIATLLVIRHSKNISVLKARWRKKNAKTKLKRRRR